MKNIIEKNKIAQCKLKISEELNIDDYNYKEEIILAIKKLKIKQLKGGGWKQREAENPADVIASLPGNVDQEDIDAVKQNWKDTGKKWEEPSEEEVKEARKKIKAVMQAWQSTMKSNEFIEHFLSLKNDNSDITKNFVETLKWWTTEQDKHLKDLFMAWPRAYDKFKLLNWPKWENDMELKTKFYNNLKEYVDYLNPPYWFWEPTYISQINELKKSFTTYLFNYIIHDTEALQVYLQTNKNDFIKIWYDMYNYGENEEKGVWTFFKK